VRIQKGMNPDKPMRALERRMASGDPAALTEWVTARVRRDGFRWLVEEMPADQFRMILPEVSESHWMRHGLMLERDVWTPLRQAVAAAAGVDQSLSRAITAALRVCPGDEVRDLFLVRTPLLDAVYARLDLNPLIEACEAALVEGCVDWVGVILNGVSIAVRPSGDGYAIEADVYLGVDADGEAVEDTVLCAERAMNTVEDGWDVDYEEEEGDGTTDLSIRFERPLAVEHLTHLAGHEGVLNRNPLMRNPRDSEFRDLERLALAGDVGAVIRIGRLLERDGVGTFDYWDGVLRRKPESVVIRAMWLNAGQAEDRPTYSVSISRTEMWYDHQYSVETSDPLTGEVEEIGGFRDEPSAEGWGHDWQQEMRHHHPNDYGDYDYEVLDRTPEEQEHETDFVVTGEMTLGQLLGTIENYYFMAHEGNDPTRWPSCIWDSGWDTDYARAPLREESYSLHISYIIPLEPVRYRDLMDADAARINEAIRTRVFSPDAVQPLDPAGTLMWNPADESTRALERAARAGDPDAARRLAAVIQRAGPHEPTMSDIGPGAVLVLTTGRTGPVGRGVGGSVAGDVWLVTALWPERGAQHSLGAQSSDLSLFPVQTTASSGPGFWRTPFLMGAVDRGDVMVVIPSRADWAAVRGLADPIACHRCGAWYTTRCVVCEMRGRRRNPDPTGDCFKWALWDAVHNGGALVHGWVLNQALLKLGARDYTAHAWVERDGMVYDWQRCEAGIGECPITLEEFAGLYEPIGEARHEGTPRLVGRAHGEGHYGPWHEPDWREMTRMVAKKKAKKKAAKKKGTAKRKTRRNSETELRALERSVAATRSPQEIARLIGMRLRLGRVSMQEARDAWLLSMPLTDPGGESRLYDWTPINFGVIPVPPGRLDQHPDTLLIHEVLDGLLPPSARVVHPTFAFSGRSDRWLARHGFVISDTGGGDTEPPFEIQDRALGDLDLNLGARDPTEHDSLSRDADIRQYDLADEYIESRPDGWPDGPEGPVAWDAILEFAGRWLVRRSAARRNLHAISILRFLRFSSTVDYVRVLSPWTFGLWSFGFRDPTGAIPEGAVYEPYGRVELDLVRTLLGGPPL